MDKNTYVWVWFMNFFHKYWGCHQMPERSFFAFGYQLPICARCTGILFGYFLGLINCFTLNLLNKHTNIIFIFPLIVDGLIQYKFDYISNNTKRLITGILFGVSFINILKNIFLHLSKYIKISKI